MPKITGALLAQEVEIECDLILSEHYNGQSNKETLRRAREFMQRGVSTYCAGPEFTCLMVREFDRRLSAVSGCAGSC